VHAWSSPRWKSGRWPGLVKNSLFSNGDNRIDVKEGFQGKSFVALLFMVGQCTYDAIYLRPLTFKTEITQKKSCVQYINRTPSTPGTASRGISGQVWQPIEPAPDPASWVHVRVVVASPTYRVYQRNSQPVHRWELSQRTSGSVGFWLAMDQVETSPIFKIIAAK